MRLLPAPAIWVFWIGVKISRQVVIILPLKVISSCCSWLQLWLVLQLSQLLLPLPSAPAINSLRFPLEAFCSPESISVSSSLHHGSVTQPLVNFYQHGCHLPRCSEQTGSLVPANHLSKQFNLSKQLPLVPDWEAHVRAISSCVKFCISLKARHDVQIFLYLELYHFNQNISLAITQATQVITL